MILTEMMQNVEIGPVVNTVIVNQEYCDLTLEKWTQYFIYLAGGQRFYIGKNLKEAHERLQITDKMFDTFITICTKVLK